MKFLSNMHTHTTFSDGVNTLEEYVAQAIRMGFVSLGFSEHALADYDPGCCIKKENIPLYFSEISRLKEKYKGQIEIYLGFESDCYTPADKTGLDFVIGSVHYIRDENGEYHTIDHTPEKFERAIKAMGGVEDLVGTYYRLVAEFTESYRPDIVGHLDLITKLNSGERYFDPAESWYKRLAESCAQRIAAAGCTVEINTGAISRGYTTEPYPGAYILSVLRELEVPVTISSDAHSTAALNCHFEQSEELLRKTGYKCVKLFRAGKFEDIGL